MSKPRVVICTDFFGKYDSYSVSNVAFTEAESLVKLGFRVSMVVRHSYPEKDEVEGVEFLKVMPHPTKIPKLDPNFAVLGKEWTDWKETAKEARDILQETLQGYDVAITHDWLLQNSCQPWNWAIRRLMLPNLTWFHRLHSYPTGERVPENELDEINELKCTLPGNGEHFLVWANNGHALWVAERYHTDISKIKVVPLGIDWPKYFGMSKESEMIVDYMDVFNADVFQCYAFCSSRLNPKGVKYLIMMFGAMKNMGYKVKLILCNANSEDKGKERPEIQAMSELAQGMGLVEFEDYCFTSRIHNRFITGVPRNTVKDLQLLGNLFVFPSETETYGLVALEAAATGAYLVLNEDLVPLKEVGGRQAMYLRWDSDHKNIRTTINWNPNEKEAMFQYARAILPELSTNRILQNKMRVLNQHYSLNVAKRIWSPLIYKYWNKPVLERGEVPEARDVRAAGKIRRGIVGEGIDKGSGVVFLPLEEKFKPRIGRGEVPEVVETGAEGEISSVKPGKAFIKAVDMDEIVNKEIPRAIEIDLAEENWACSKCNHEMVRGPSGLFCPKCQPGFATPEEFRHAEIQCSDPNSEPSWPDEGS